MRSELVYQAGANIENRFLLASTAMRAVKKLHVNSTRTEDTVNNVLAEMAKGTRVIGTMPDIASSPSIDLLITPGQA